MAAIDGLKPSDVVPDARGAPRTLNIAQRPLHTGGQAVVHVATLDGMPVLLKMYTANMHAMKEWQADATMDNVLSKRHKRLFVPGHYSFQCAVQNPPSIADGRDCSVKELCLMDLQELLEPVWAHGVASLSGNVALRRLLRDAVQGVAQMHANGIAHNDIKMCNILVSTQDVSRVYSAREILFSDLPVNHSVAEQCLLHAARAPGTAQHDAKRVASVYNHMRDAVVETLKKTGDLKAALPAAWFSKSSRLTARVADLGMAHVADEGVMPLKRNTRIVSPDLTPPELMWWAAQQAARSEDDAPLEVALDEMSMDVYSIGVMVHGAVTGVMPYTSSQPSERDFRGFMQALYGKNVHLTHPCMTPSHVQWEEDVPSWAIHALSKLTPACVQFLRACMHPNPTRRLHCSMLLNLPFLRNVRRRSYNAASSE